MRRAKALLLQNVGDAKFPNLKTIEVREQRIWPPTTGDDKPGAASVRSATAVVPSPRPIGTISRTGISYALAIISMRWCGADQIGWSWWLRRAPLGMIRTAYSHASQGRDPRRVDKDFVKMRVHEIEKRLAGTHRTRAEFRLVRRAGNRYGRRESLGET